MRVETRFQGLELTGPHGLFWPHAEIWAAELVRPSGEQDGPGAMPGGSRPDVALRCGAARPELRAIYCERAALQTLQGRAAGLPAAPVGLLETRTIAPGAASAWFGRGGDTPMELLILSDDAATGPALPLSLPAPGLDGSLRIDCGRLGRLHLRLAADGALFERAVLAVPAGHVGPAAAWSVLHGVRALLEHLTAAPRPLLIRLDRAGLGLDRREDRILERRLSRQLMAYGWQTGRPALLLGEGGHIVDGGRARIDLLPRRSARLDVVLPEGRRMPSYVEIRVPALRCGRVAPLRISVRAPGEEPISVRTGPESRLAQLTDLAGHLRAFILPRTGNQAEARTHVHTLGFAPTTRSLHHGRGRADPCAWEITLSNCGSDPVSLSCAAAEAVSILSPAVQRVAGLRASESLKWDLAALDFVDPVFEGVLSRLDQVARRGTAVPPRVLRRLVDPDLWPRTTVHHGLRGYSVPAGSFGPQGDCDLDPLVGLCLDTLRRGGQEHTDQLLAQALSLQ